LVWAALRFGAAGASVAMLTTTLLAIWGAAHGHGPFSTRSPEENAQAMQIFLTLATMVVLMLGATVEERSRAEERFMKAFRLCPDPMLICRRSDGLVIDSNNRWQETFGFRSLAERPQTVLDLDIYASNLDQGRLRTNIFERAPFRDLELNLRSSQGEVLQTLASADLAEMSGEPCFIFVLRDLTDRKRAQQATENLAHVSRLAVLGEMTAMIAHEVNQPLGAILSNADAADLLLEKEGVNLGEVKRILADIRKDDLRAGEAIQRVRALLRRKEIQMQPLDLNETAADVIKLLLGEAARKHVIIRSEFDIHLPFVLGDRVQLQQVLLNLLMNGMEAMLDTPISTRYLTVQTCTNNDRVEFAVKDAGYGILEENLPRLFDSFFTTKKDGMGLGLAIARSIIEAHQGQIWAENCSDGGAVFRVALPSKPGSRCSGA
jgi:PAS domain S-box-containing protein